MDCCSLKSTTLTLLVDELVSPVLSRVSTVQCPVTFSILVQRLEILISVSEDLNRGTVHCPAESRPSSCTQVYSYTQLNDTEQSLLHNCDVEPGKFGANLDQSLLVGAHLHLVCGMLINLTTLHLILKAPISWLKLSLRRLMLSFSYRLWSSFSNDHHSLTHTSSTRTH